MAKIAIIKTGGKQYKVKEGQTLKIEKLDLEPGQSMKFDTLMVADESGNEINLGTPSLGDLVEGKLLEQGKARKITVTKYKNKTRYLRNVGHRQRYSKIEIEKIG